MLIWIDVAHAWTEGARQLISVLCASLHCVEMMTVRVAYFALADILPRCKVQVCTLIARPASIAACLQLWHTSRMDQ